MANCTTRSSQSGRFRSSREIDSSLHEDGQWLTDGSANYDTFTPLSRPSALIAWRDSLRRDSSAAT